jgi:CRP-like cAMP-binding protein
MARGSKRSGRLPVDRQSCRARVDGLCDGCAPEVLPTLARYKTGDRVIEAGQDLFSFGEPCEAIYGVLEGWLFLYDLLADGRRQIFHFALPGAVLGFHATRGGIATYGAQALTDAIVCIVPRKRLASLWRRHPEIGMRLAWLISRRLSLAYAHLTSIGRHPARQRVAHLLLELYIRYRMQWPGSRIEEMHLPLTQEHIGDATGLTGVHVNRMLRDLRKDGVVEFHHQRLRILDPDKLIDVAGIDPDLIASWT